MTSSTDRNTNHYPLFNLIAFYLLVTNSFHFSMDYLKPTSAIESGKQYSVVRSMFMNAHNFVALGKSNYVLEILESCITRKRYTQTHNVAGKIPQLKMGTTVSEQYEFSQIEILFQQISYISLCPPLRFIF